MALDMPLDAALKEKYPAKAHVRKVAKWLKEHGGDGKGVIYLEGQKDRLIEVRLVYLLIAAPFCSVLYLPCRGCGT